MKTQRLLPLLIALMMLASGFNRTYAQACPVTCTGAWTNALDTFVDTMNGCPYKFYLNYRYRPCMGSMQIEFTPTSTCTCLGFIVEQLNPNPGCDLHCPNVPMLFKMVYRRMMLTLGTSILHAAPSSCYYIGSIIVPPGAESCMGMIPGTKRYVTVACNTTGCCYSKIEPYGANGLKQTVISSTPCPPPPTGMPSSWTINWSCDVLGGGYNTYSVTFTPDMPLTCETICSDGVFNFAPGNYPPPATKNSGTTSINTVDHNTITGINIYPNPVQESCKVEFNSANAGENITIELSDISGKVVAIVNAKSKQGNQSIELDTKKLAPGMYTLKLTSGEHVYVRKITK